ncbi:hypothetical protein SDC9_199630 [bioreactor metagenome]|uniref:Uncharacterized protein n=1 Tax=bioreactor metagenome TaxID=1076179 RepID=A0A645IKZ8_9ZZZZ
MSGKHGVAALQHLERGLPFIEHHLNFLAITIGLHIEGGAGDHRPGVVGVHYKRSFMLGIYIKIGLTIDPHFSFSQPEFLRIADTGISI